jgi:hypothetical protein
MRLVKSLNSINDPPMVKVEFRQPLDWPSRPSLQVGGAISRHFLRNQTTSTSDRITCQIVALLVPKGYLKKASIGF